MGCVVAFHNDLAVISDVGEPLAESGLFVGVAAAAEEGDVMYEGVGVRV